MSLGSMAQATHWLGGYWNFNEFTNDVVKVQATHLMGGYWN